MAPTEPNIEPDSSERGLESENIPESHSPDSLRRTNTQAMLDYFLGEPLGDGNRNAMLPYQPSNEDIATRRAEDHMEQKLQSLDRELGDARGRVFPVPCPEPIMYKLMMDSAEDTNVSNNDQKSETEPIENAMKG